MIPGHFYNIPFWIFAVDSDSVRRILQTWRNQCKVKAIRAKLAVKRAKVLMLKGSKVSIGFI